MIIADRIWIWLMKFFAPTCHQRAERSFYIGNYQFPVCARCTGMYIGFIFAILSAALVGVTAISVNIVCMAIMLIDWTIQFKKILISNNIRRLFTGILGGYGTLGIIINVFYVIM